MNIKYKIDLGNQLNQAELVTIAREIIKWGGTGWYQRILVKHDIKGRTKMLDAFRWGWSNTPGRTDADKEEATLSTLQHMSVENLLEGFLIEFPLSRATMCIKDALEVHGYMKYSYTIEAIME
ncbi:MAG: hypothetical protein H8D23_11030 [Candidatus Brocadiales bacterium]|nr:hypothetical protein [Candidatus Brocadiales bacterium]